MKAIILAIILSVFSLAASPAERVKGYQRKDGTYVQSHRKTSGDHSRLNNYSTKGNVNPYTGKKGVRDPYKKTKSKRR